MCICKGVTFLVKIAGLTLFGTKQCSMQATVLCVYTVCVHSVVVSIVSIRKNRIDRIVCVYEDEAKSAGLAKL